MGTAGTFSHSCNEQISIHNNILTYNNNILTYEDTIVDKYTEICLPVYLYIFKIFFI